MSDYTVTVIGESGEFEVGGPELSPPPYPIVGWESAIKAAWSRIGRIGLGGWKAARVVGPQGVTLHLRGEDADAALAAQSKEVRDLEKKHKEEIAAGGPSFWIGGDPEDEA